MIAQEAGSQRGLSAESLALGGGGGNMQYIQMVLDPQTRAAWFLEETVPRASGLRILGSISQLQKRWPLKFQTHATATSGW